MVFEKNKPFDYNCKACKLCMELSGIFRLQCPECETIFEKNNNEKPKGIWNCPKCSAKVKNNTNNQKNFPLFCSREMFGLCTSNDKARLILLYDIKKMLGEVIKK